MKKNTVILISTLFFLVLSYSQDRPSEKLNDNSSEKRIGFLKKGKQLDNFPLSSKQEVLITLVPASEYVNSYIQQIHIPLEKIKHYNNTDKLYKNMNAAVQINIYKSENDYPTQKIFSSEPIKFILSKNEEIVLDVSKQKILLFEQGISVGIEILDIEDGKNISKESIYTRVALTDQSSEDFKAITYLVKDNDFTPINKMNEHLSKDLRKYQSQNYNLAIGLVLK